MCKHHRRGEATKEGFEDQPISLLIVKFVSVRKDLIIILKKSLEFRSIVCEHCLEAVIAFSLWLREKTALTRQTVMPNFMNLKT